MLWGPERPSGVLTPPAGVTWFHSQLGCRIKSERVPCPRHKDLSVGASPSGGVVMVSAKGFFDTWIFSVGAMLFILSILMGFSALVSVLMSRIWREVRDDAATARMNGTSEEPPFRKAA